MKEFKKQIVYYTDSRLEEDLDNAVRNQITKASDGIPIISVSQKPLDFGKNINVGYKPRCYLSLYEQLLTGLEETQDDAIIYLCEHDVFYHASHFDFIPPRDKKIYFNLNRYYTARDENFFVPSIGKRALSQCVSYKKPLIDHVKEQVESRLKGIASPCIGSFMNFSSKFPNVDVRHGGNLSISDRFNKYSEKIWVIEGWGTPRMLRAEVGYKEHGIKVRKHLHILFNTKYKENPITVSGLKRNMFPAMFRALQFKRGAEIGVKYGEFSLILCKGMHNEINLKCIDPYAPCPEVSWDEQEKNFVVARTLLKDFNAQFIKKTSLHAADEDVAKSSLDFVYIDASHDFNDFMQDLIVWTDRVRNGGIVSGHDYDNTDIKTAVDVFTKIHDYELFITDKGEGYPDANPSWFFAKESL